MEVFNANVADSIFVTAIQQESQLAVLSNQALSNGIDKYMRQDYEAGAQEFEKSINLYPRSSFSADATKYLAQTHLRLAQTDKAIAVYKRGIELNPDRDDLYTDLGNLYFAEDRYEAALDQYKEAVRINPTSASNHYSLGQGYLKLEKFSQAEAEFRTVSRIEGASPYGNYGLGLTYSKRGKYDKAIDNFEEALRKDNQFFDAYAEIGYALADLGEMDDAKAMAASLEKKDPELADTLARYINKVEPPKIVLAWGSSTFSYKMSINTPVAALDSYLENAGTSKSMTMKFYFNKDMDRSAIEDRYNWRIGRQSGAGGGQAYNFGLNIPDSEIRLPSFPDYVLYDSRSQTATVAFTVTQNEAANGTIDPSHIIFKFKGEDANGIAMDAQHDEFSGWSGVA